MESRVCRILFPVIYIKPLPTQSRLALVAPTEEGATAAK
jgi:hypothetical protein